MTIVTGGERSSGKGMRPLKEADGPMVRGRESSNEGGEGMKHVRCPLRVVEQHSYLEVFPAPPVTRVGRLVHFYSMAKACASATD
jgi:hypothetical protein